jgi:adenine phosphoribosyltransferase
MYEDLKEAIRIVPDFPKKGIMFRDVTTLFIDPAATKKAMEVLFEFIKDVKIDKVVGIEARGFVGGALLADKLNVGFVPVRKPGKLPAETIKETYELEYGSDSIEIHKDSIKPGEKVLIHDDLLATGGTALAACKLVEKLGGEVMQLSFFMELSFLGGREKLKGYDVKSIIDYESEE